MPQTDRTSLEQGLRRDVALLKAVDVEGRFAATVTRHSSAR